MDDDVLSVLKLTLVGNKEANSILCPSAPRVHAASGLRVSLYEEALQLGAPGDT